MPYADDYNKNEELTKASDVRNLASDKQVIHQKMQLWTKIKKKMSTQFG
ncbi:MAG: hypothetical protein WBW34_13185 [Nitrososphaeraceae archaeon]